MPDKPVLSPADPWPRDAHRIVVAGTSGAGKTALAQRISEVSGLPYTEIDSLFHGPGWQPRPEFLADVERLVAGESWVTEWQYAAVRPLLANRADLLVWLDLPRHVVMRQVTARTVRRRVLRQVLWNGNKEGPLRYVFTDPEHVIRWAWATYERNRALVLQLTKTHPELPILRVTSHRQAQKVVEELTR